MDEREYQEIVKRKLYINGKKAYEGMKVRTFREELAVLLWWLLRLPSAFLAMVRLKM